MWSSANLAILLRKMPPLKAAVWRVQIWPHRNGRYLLSNKGPIKVLRGCRWRYMKKRLEKFAKANSRKWGGNLSARLVWREGNRKHVVEDVDTLSGPVEGGTWRVLWLT